MSFDRNYNKIAIKSNNVFATQLTNIADATTNISPDIIIVTDYLGISKDRTLKILLSTNSDMKESIVKLKNLTKTLKNYEFKFDGLPEQLNTQLTNLRNEISENKQGIDEVPSYFRILLPQRQIVDSYVHDGIRDSHINDVYENNFGQDYPQDYYSDDDDNNVTNIELVKFANVKKENIKDDACPICLSLLKEEQQTEEIVSTKCNHQFHNVCISQWNTYNEKCPLCRAKL